jgi:peptidoglycan hydrolase CwlO-like protein
VLKETNEKWRETIFQIDQEKLHLAQAERELIKEQEKLSKELKSETESTIEKYEEKLRTLIQMNEKTIADMETEKQNLQDWSSKWDILEQENKSLSLQ